MAASRWRFVSFWLLRVVLLSAFFGFCRPLPPLPLLEWVVLVTYLSLMTLMTDTYGLKWNSRAH